MKIFHPDVSAIAKAVFKILWLPTLLVILGLSFLIGWFSFWFWISGGSGWGALVCVFGLVFILIICGVTFYVIDTGLHKK